MSLEDIIKLNVGGRVFMTKRRTLCAQPDSLLGRMFDPDSEFAQPTEIDGCAFLDRDPDMFAHVLNFLRGKEVLCSEMSKIDLLSLKEEADFYSLSGLVSLIETSFIRKKNLAKITDALEAQSKASASWKL